MAATSVVSLLVLLILPCVVIGADVTGIGVACVYSTDNCLSTGTICDVTGKCLYKAGVVCADGTTKCMSGATCQSISSQCTCNTAAYDLSTDVCVAKANKVGGTCTTTCDDTHATCPGSGTKKCACNNGYTVRYSDATCVVTPDTYGGTCSAATGNVADTCVAKDANAVCTNSVCACKTGYTGSIGGKCSGAMGLASSLFLVLSALFIVTRLH